MSRNPFKRRKVRFLTFVVILAALVVLGAMSWIEAPFWTEAPPTQVTFVNDTHFQVFITDCTSDLAFLNPHETNVFPVPSDHQSQCSIEIPNRQGLYVPMSCFTLPIPLTASTVVVISDAQHIPRGSYCPE
jgi:hypothetical protein